MSNLRADVIVQSIPTLPLSKVTEAKLRQVIDDAIDRTRRLLCMFEPWQEFRIPAFCNDTTKYDVTWQLDTLIGQDTENLIAADIGFTNEQSDALCRDLDEAILIRAERHGSDCGDEENENDEDDEDGDDSSQSVFDFSERSIAEGFLSYLIGIAFGRWDIRFALDRTLLPNAQRVLDPLPVCPPASLVGIDGLPANAGGIVSEEWLRNRPDASHIPDVTSVQQATICDKEYSIAIPWNGILVDDSEHNSDVLRSIQQVIDLMKKGDLLDEVDWSLCRTLGVKNLREYLRKPGKGGFWDDHVNRYKAKRGRKAPIYWLLQSSKKNYALWIYYHRLDKDILFKALLNYVEPKIRREESRLDELRSQKTALSPAAKGAKKLDKDINRQEAFLSELRDFEDKLRRAANLHLDPDLNDGVVLNIAPLRELVPWKEAKSYWDDLMDGKYEWSSIGKQLREKGVVPC